MQTMADTKTEPKQVVEEMTGSLETLDHHEKIQRLVNDNPNILQITNILFQRIGITSESGMASSLTTTNWSLIS